MKVVVVYESMYGNTRHIAAAIGRGLAHLGEIQVGSVADTAAASVADADLLVVGGPTHVHGMSRPSTRAAAVTEADDDESIDLDQDAPGPGLREWLAELPRSAGASCASFDTRVDKPVLLVGSAARGISKRLKRRGYLQLKEPASFFVEGNAGPLSDNEEVRAQQWAADLSNDLLRLERATAHQNAADHC